jgi:hypothetical protein
VGSLATRLNRGALALAALGLSAHVALSTGSLGDYPVDARPAIDALLHGDIGAFGRAQPAMGDVSLFVRAPFAAIAYLGTPTEMAVYRWGSLACVLALALVALLLAGVARRRGSGPLAEWAIVLVALLNPTVSSAMTLGHPEELLTASLAVGALLAALDDRALLATVLLGLALACKQWTVVLVLPVILTLERRRVRALLGAASVAVVALLPELVAGPATFVRNQASLSHYPGRLPPPESWVWPFTSVTTLHVTVEGSRVPVTQYALPAALAQSLHAVMIAVNLLFAAVVGVTRRLPLRGDAPFALMSAVLLVRCSIDTMTMPYYYATLLLGLLAWDAARGERIPVRGLTAAAAAYLLFDRLPPAPGTLNTASVLCMACSITAMVFFLRALGWRLPRSRRDVGSRRPVAA